MNKRYITEKEYFHFLKKEPKFLGSEGKLYEDPDNQDMLLKFYIEQKYCNERLYFLEEISKFQNRISGIQFPYGGLFFNNNLVGVMIHYYKDSFCLKKLYELGIDYEQKLELLYILNRKIKDMLEHGIYHMDFHNENVLVNLNCMDVYPIDLDSFNIVLGKNQDLETRFMWLYRNVLLETLFFDFHYQDELEDLSYDGIISFDFCFSNILSAIGFSDKMIMLLSDMKNIDMCFWDNFLDYVKKRKIMEQDFEYRQEKIKKIKKVYSDCVFY